MAKRQNLKADFRCNKSKCGKEDDNDRPRYDSY